MWEDKLYEYDQQAQHVLDDLKVRHVREYEEQESILKVHLMNKRPRFSAQVVQQRSLLERCIQQRRYLEAEDIKKKLAAMEKQEISSFDSQLSSTFEKRVVVLKQQFLNEIKAVEQKVKLGREELLAQRKTDFEKLVRRHANVLRELDQDTKLHIAKTRQYVHRQVKALIKDPVKSGLDLRGVGRTFLDKSVEKAMMRSRIDVSRAKTPPPSSIPWVRSTQREGLRGMTPTTGSHARSIAFRAQNMSPRRIAMT